MPRHPRFYTLTGLNSTNIASPGIPMIDIAWSIPPLVTPTCRSAVQVNSATSPLVKFPTTPSTAAIAREDEHTIAAELDKPLPAGSDTKHEWQIPHQQWCDGHRHLRGEDAWQEADACAVSLWVVLPCMIDATLLSR